jgi:hypothetical protein
MIHWLVCWAARSHWPPSNLGRRMKKKILHLLLITTWVRELRKEDVSLHFWVWFFVWTSVFFYFLVFFSCSLVGVFFLYLFNFFFWEEVNNLSCEEKKWSYMMTYLLTCQFTRLTTASSCNKPRLKSLTSLPNFPLPCGRGGTDGPLYIDSKSGAKGVTI